LGNADMEIKMTSKRAAVLDTALRLFSTYGYHSIGVDRIKDEAGVSKMTLYKYFPTKEALIESVLMRRDELFREDLERTVAIQASCLDKVHTVFRWHDEWFHRSEFHGCMFIKASEEFPEASSEIRRISMQHKEYVRQMLQSILEAGGVRDANLLAWHLLIMLEGMIVNANMFSDCRCVDTCWRFARELLEGRIGSPSSQPVVGP
jgi:AcrR family transcriptional regulator